MRQSGEATRLSFDQVCIHFGIGEAMGRYKTMNEPKTEAYTLPLILPMHRSLNRVMNSNSPWVATDPVLLRECLAAYRSVRLILLALIALVSGPKRVQAKEANGECQWHIATAHIEANQTTNSGSLRHSSAFCETVQARIDHFALLVSEAPINGDVNCGALALALDAPKQPSHSREAARTHAPPFGLILMNLDAPRLDRSLTLPQSVAYSATPLFPPIPRAELFAQFVSYPPSSQNGCLVAGALYLPKRQSLHLEVIRAHAPPVQRHLLDFKALPIHPSTAFSASSEFISFASPASINLVLSKFRFPYCYLPPVLQQSYHPYFKSCPCGSPEGSSLRTLSPLVSTQPNRLKGGHLYVCQ